MSPDEIKTRFPNASRAFIAANSEACCRSQSPQPKPTDGDEPLAEVPRAQGHGQRYAVCITSFRSRLLDPDNLCAKYFVDCLRYAGLISDDTACVMDYRIRQEKAEKKELQRTEITITKL